MTILSMQMRNSDKDNVKRTHKRRDPRSHRANDKSDGRVCPDDVKWRNIWSLSQIQQSK